MARVADMIAYVNHDIDDALRAGLLAEADLPTKPIALLGGTTSKRISRLVTDVILQTMKAELDQVRMSDEILDALLALRAFLFEAVYENSDATVEFKKASGLLLLEDRNQNLTLQRVSALWAALSAARMESSDSSIG